MPEEVLSVVYNLARKSSILKASVPCDDWRSVQSSYEPNKKYPFKYLNELPNVLSRLFDENIEKFTCFIFRRRWTTWYGGVLVKVFLEAGSTKVDLQLLSFISGHNLAISLPQSENCLEKQFEYLRLICDAKMYNITGELFARALRRRRKGFVFYGNTDFVRLYLRYESRIGSSFEPQNLKFRHKEAKLLLASGNYYRVAYTFRRLQKLNYLSPAEQAVFLEDEAFMEVFRGRAAKKCVIL